MVGVLPGPSMQREISVALVAKGVAALGTLLAFIAVWVDAAGGQSYWSGDRTTGVFCLLLVLAVAASLALSVVRPDPQLELIAAVLAFTMWGHYTFIPAALASHSGLIEAGGWLGLIGGGFAAVGAGVAYGLRYAGTPLTLARPAGRPPVPPQPVLAGMALAALGLQLGERGGDRRRAVTHRVVDDDRRFEPIAEQALQQLRLALGVESER